MSELDAKKLHLSENIAATGIQEKYLRSQLGMNEPLTELDLKRFVNATSLAEAIQVVNFNIEAITAGIKSKTQTQQTATEPFTIPLMVNLNSNEQYKTPQWASLVMTVNPLSKNISYKVTSESAINDQQKKLINEAISTSFSDAASISATYSLTPETTGGYHIFHDLCCKETIHILNSEIQNFTQLKDLKAIRRAVYETELRAMRVDKTTLDLLPLPIKEQVKDGMLQDEAIKRQINLLEHSMSTVTALHPVVSEKVAEFSIYQTKIAFPGEGQHLHLSSVDYQQFLLLIQEKFRDVGSKKVLDQIAFPVSIDALHGIMAFNDTNQTLPFKKLVLDFKNVNLKDQEVRAALLFNLKSTLMSLSLSRLDALELRDENNQIDEEFLQTLSSFVKARNIAIDITLPIAYQTSHYQKEIDAATCDNIRARNVTKFEKTHVPIKPIIKSERKTRRRPKGSSKNLAIDIELQQEQQQQTAISNESSVKKARKNADLVNIEEEALDIGPFIAMIMDGNFSASAKGYLIGSKEPDDCLELWDNWLGLLSFNETYSNESTRLSKSACEELLRHKDQFQYGLDLNNLPAGFVLKQDERGLYIIFDENLKKITPYDPLQVQIDEDFVAAGLTPSQINSWLNSIDNNHPIKIAWNKLNNATSYDKKVCNEFLSRLPQLLLLDNEQLKSLFDLCFEENSLNKDKFEFLLNDVVELKRLLAKDITDSALDKKFQNMFSSTAAQAKFFMQNYAEKMPDFEQHLLHHVVAQDDNCKTVIKKLIAANKNINLNALLQVYLLRGSDGIEVFANLVEKEQAFFNKLPSLLTNTDSYLSFLDDKIPTTFEAIKGFSVNEQRWFFSLLQQHAGAQRNVNLSDMANAFKKFKKELRDLDIPDLPNECKLADVKSMPVALSRIINLLHHCREVDRKMQLQELAALDFASCGIPKAIRSTGLKNWAFFTPEMEINSKTQIQTQLSAQAPSNWQVIGTGTTSAILRDFYRYASFQKKNEQLPLEFYKYAQGKIDNSGFSTETKAHLYALIASATTGKVKVKQIKSIDAATSDIDSILSMLTFSFLPNNVAADVRADITDSLFCLEEVPPLPVLKQLISIIKASLSNPLTALKNARRLQKTNKQLDCFVKTLGVSVYDGLKHYSAADYESDKELFFNHIAAIEKINDKIKHESLKKLLISLISTFKLTTEDIDALAGYFADRAPNSRCIELLTIMQDISLEDNKSLSKDDFTYILDAIQKDPETPVIDVIKNNLKQYFPSKYFLNYNEKSVSAEVVLLISKNYNEQQQVHINNMLLHFSNPNDSTKYREIVEKLVEITTHLSAIDKNIFIAKLCSAEGLFIPVKPLRDPNNPFINLLDIIIAQGSPDPLLNFIAAERNLLKESDEEQRKSFFTQQDDKFFISHLAEKANILMNDVLPMLPEIAKDLQTIDLMPLIQKIILKSSAEDLYKNLSVLKSLIQTVNKIAKNNPSSKKQFLDLINTYLNTHQEKHVDLLHNLAVFVTILDKTFAKTTDHTIVLSLCLQFNNAQGELTPDSLMALLNTVDTFPEAHQLTMLRIAVSLINDEKNYNLKDFQNLCDLCISQPALVAKLAKIYERAPFPSIAQVQSWHEEAIKASDYNKKIDENYTKFSVKPSHRENVNRFHATKARAQFKQLKLNGKEPSLKEIEDAKEYFTEFTAITLEMREKTSEELINIFENFKRQDEIDYDLLVAIAAELLHRSKGRDEVGDDGKPKLGSSFEINTTQYLAILSMLKEPGHITSQIGTGEGKSRIMMISLACQNALGKTVDFVTSDAQLATRDFVEYKSYFEMIGAKTSMIFANSSPDEYVIGGINFSDPANLSLFRNKARSIGLGKKVLDQDEKNRALLIDEADKTYFDVADTRFNFSQESSEDIRGMEWVYPLLMEYFAQPTVTLADNKSSISPIELYYEDIDQSREKFLQFASSICSDAQLIRLKALSDAQIEQWQVSAITASQLEFNKDFVISPDVLISTSSGPKISSEASLLFADRVSKSSKFSFGVHQCLHARLNLAREHLEKITNASLHEALKKCEQAFYVSEEKQIVYSSTSKNLVDDYKFGTIKAVTGTYGSILEREEARQLCGRNRENRMHFIDVPRDQGLKRKDKAARLTANAKQQFDTLVQQIKEARAKNQPILIIAENVQESAALFKKLSDVFNDIQHIHSQLSAKDEKNMLEKAGTSGQITVSTAMIGRGTDISLKSAAKQHGLNVMLTYLPRVRDLQQIIGRSGRFGASGESSIVLDKTRLPLTSDYYLNAEAYLEREQAIMDRNKQCDRLLKNTVGDFRLVVTNNFFADLLTTLTKEDYKKCLPIWTNFFDKSDKAWNETWPLIQVQLSQDAISIQQLEALLQIYKNTVQILWQDLRQKINDLELGKDKVVVDLLKTELPPLVLPDEVKLLIENFDKPKSTSTKEKSFTEYEQGHEGRAVSYAHWYIPWIATFKGYLNLLPGVNLEDARKPFANFKAWLDNRGILFPNLRALWANIKNLFSSKNNVTEHKTEYKTEKNPTTMAAENNDFDSSYRFLTKLTQKERLISADRDLVAPACVKQQEKSDGVTPSGLSSDNNAHTLHTNRDLVAPVCAEQKENNDNIISSELPPKNNPPTLHKE